MMRRGTKLNPQNRFLPIAMEVTEECYVDEEDLSSTLKTEWFRDDTQSIVTENKSPDIPFRYSVNPYRGCEHGCSYCYARTYHEYLGWNAGQDFESKILVKSNAATLLRKWLGRASWAGSEHLCLSGVTDPYQPIERKLKITRSLLSVLCEARQATLLITKNALITRDIDLLAVLASDQAVAVTLSITTLDKKLAQSLEPRCSVPEARLRAIRELSNASIPVHVNVAPVIPGLNDHELPAILEAAAIAGARSASWGLLRLPGSVEPIFLDWLEQHFPFAKAKVVERLKRLRQGGLQDSQFGRRMHGEGFFADQWTQLFHLIRMKHQLASGNAPLNTHAFRPPRTAHGQQYLF